MAGILVEYTRFVEVQQRRARVVAQLAQLRDTPVEANGATAIEDDPNDESQREFCSMSNDAAHRLTRGGEDTRHTTGGSVDVR